MSKTVVHSRLAPARGGDRAGYGHAGSQRQKLNHPELCPEIPVAIRRERAAPRGRHPTLTSGSTKDDGHRGSRLGRPKPLSPSPGPAASRWTGCLTGTWGRVTRTRSVWEAPAGVRCGGRGFHLHLR